MSEEADVNTQNEGETESRKHPEAVSWTQYIGLKEKFNKVESELKGKVESLEEQLKNAPGMEEFKRIKQELEELKPKFQQASEELKSIKDKTVSEMRESLKSRGIPENELAEMSEKELSVLMKAVGSIKPKPDLGVGRGSGELRGSPMDLARRAYESSR